MGRTLAILVATLGCSVANPAFDGDDASTSSTGGKDTNTAAQADDDDDDGGTTAGDTTRGEDTISIGEGSTTDPDATETGRATSDTGSACSLPDVATIGITLLDQTDRPVEAPCVGEIVSGHGGVQLIDDTTVQVFACEPCPCEGEPEGRVTLQVEGVQLPAMPACAQLVAWGTTTHDGDCAWGGAAIVPNAPLPHWFATNTLELPPEIGGPLTVATQPGQPCPSETCDQAGERKLAFPEGPLEVDDPPTVVTLELVAGVPFEVDVLHASIDEACDERVAWTALIDD